MIRKKVEVHEYKCVVLGLISLRYKTDPKLLNRFKNDILGDKDA